MIKAVKYRCYGVPVRDRDHLKICRGHYDYFDARDHLRGLEKDKPNWPMWGITSRTDSALAELGWTQETLKGERWSNAT